MSSGRLPKLTRTEMAATARQLVGRRLDRVAYLEIAYDGVSRPSWNLDARCDSLDFGLDLHTADGWTFGIIWDSDFCPYGLSLRPTSVRGRLLASAAWDVTAVSRWAGLHGSTLARVDVGWEPGPYDEGECPQRTDLRFADGRSAHLWSAHFVDGVAWQTCADHITVTFDGAE